MKTIISVISLFFTTLFFAQNSIEKTIGEFTELKVYDLIEVRLIQSNENKVTITGENQDDVLVNNKNGKLKIKMTLKKIFDGNKTTVTLHYTSIDIIDVNEGAKVSSQEIIKQFEMDLKAQEGGQIMVPLNTNYTNIKSVTGGIIKTTGSCKIQDISLSTGGVYEAENFNTEETKILIKAAGEAYVKASNLVDIKIRAGGDVFIYGNPKTINESKVFGGRVKKMN